MEAWWQNLVSWYETMNEMLLYKFIYSEKPLEMCHLIFNRQNNYKKDETVNF